MKKVILEVDDNGNIIDKIGNIVGVTFNYQEVEDEKGSLTLDLVKQGVTVDEIIKLKNADLI